MSDINYTPGPWAVGEFQDTGRINQRSIQPTIGVAYGNEQESLANANLIATSPDFLDLAKRLVQWDKDFQVGSAYMGGLEALDKIIADSVAAIAKATGVKP